MYTDTGKPHLVAPEGVQRALSAGWRLRSHADDFADFGSGVKAFGTGVAQSLLHSLDIPNGQAGVPVEEYEKYRPGANIAGQITGAMADLFVPGGAATGASRAHCVR